MKLHFLLLVLAGMLLTACAAPVRQYAPPVSAQRPLTFEQAKQLLYSHIFYDHRETLYCCAEFDEQRNVALPYGFASATHWKRSGRVEAEHIVPVENFGRTFAEWREGHPLCVNKDGQPFKGRRCAELANETFRNMEDDLHNLYPAIGSVNAARGNKNFAMLGRDVPASFGTCEMKIEDGKAEPPEPSRGIIARAYLYFDKRYDRFRMSRQQRKLMETWDRLYPPDAWECERNERIRTIQGNGNEFVERFCR